MASSTYALTMPNATAEPENGNAGADEVQGGGAGAVDDDILSLKDEPGRINLLREAGNFTCFTSAIALGTGLELCGAPMLPLQRLRHIVGSFVMYSSVGLMTWLLSYLVFGFSNNVAIGLGVAIFLDFMFFMVPMEQSLWGEPLVGHFVKKYQKELMAINHNSIMITMFLFMFILYTLPLCVFVLPLLVSNNVDERMTPGMQVATWICIISSVVLNALFTGWAPLANIVGERFGHYLSKNLVENYCNSVLAELVDDKNSIERRRMRLGLLYERQGKVIANALKRGPNFQNICTLLFNLVWMVVGIVWLFPDAAGGLTNIDKALAPQPAFRITIATSLLLSLVHMVGYGTLKIMSQPHALFEERIRSTIGPHALRLHTASQLFCSTDQLWHFVHDQNIAMSLFGIPIDSALPGKIAPFVGTLVGAVAWGIARSQ